jgi:hypothetical protein
MKKNMGIRKTVAMCLFTFALLLANPRNGFCSFENNWGGSDGDHQIARWLVGNGYHSEYNDALGFARNNYIGHNSGDADGYFWNTSQPVTFEIMAEESAHADYSTLGYYTGSGDSKVLNQIFGGLENGPKSVTINESFGLYLGIWDNMKWYTDRSENHEQSGLLKNMNGDPQGLIYELKPGQEWLIAWEDLDTTQSWADNDFNDMYLKVSVGTTTVPEPVSSALFLLGSGAMAVSRMRKKILI